MENAKEYHLKSKSFKPKELKLTYLGVENPTSPLEIEFEISGLETLISEAKYKISQLKQGKILAQCLSGKEDDYNLG